MTTCNRNLRIYHQIYKEVNALFKRRSKYKIFTSLFTLGLALSRQFGGAIIGYGSVSAFIIIPLLLLSLNQCLASIFWTEAVGQWSLWIGQLDYLRLAYLLRYMYHINNKLHILILPGVILFIMLDELVLDMFTQIMHENMTIFAQLPTAWCVHYHKDLRLYTVPNLTLMRLIDQKYHGYNQSNAV